MYIFRGKEEETNSPEALQRLSQKGFVCCMSYLEPLITLAKDFQLLRNWKIWKIRTLSRSQSRVIFCHKNLKLICHYLSIELLDLSGKASGRVGTGSERRWSQSLSLSLSLPLFISPCPHWNPIQQLLGSLWVEFSGIYKKVTLTIPHVGESPSQRNKVF